MYWMDNHGNIYGPFAVQADGFPNAGEVVRYYRGLMGLTQIALALLLGINQRWVLKMENHNQVPQNLSRRRVIADILKIPPVLLGIGVMGSYLVPLEEAHAHMSVLSYNIEEANEYLDTAWEVNFYTGSPYLLPGVKRWEARIKEQVSHGGPEQERNLDLLHQYKHFLLMAGRDAQDYTWTDPIGLIDAANQLNDPDALGVSLYRRGKMYFQQKNYNEAIKDIRQALYEVEHAGPQVKGLALVGSGPVLAHYATDKAGVREVLDNLDEAWKLIDKAKGYPDPFRAKFDESWYFLARTSSMIPLLRFDATLLDEVFESLDLAQQQTKPQYIRRKAQIEILYAEAAFYAGDYLSATSTALGALEIAQSIELAWNIEGIQNLYNKLTQTKMKDSSELRKLKIALAKKSSPN